MKINEVITEAGFWDTIKAGASAIAGIPKGNAQSNWNTSIGNANTSGWANTVMQRWQKERLPSLPKNDKGEYDPTQYKTELNKFLTQYLGNDYSSNLDLASTDPKTVGAFIRQAVDAERLQNPVAKPEAPAPEAPAPTADTMELVPKDGEVTPAPEAPAALDPSVAADIRSSLKSLGHKPKEIEEMMKKVSPDATVDSGLRQAMGSRPTPTPTSTKPTPTPTPTPTSTKPTLVIPPGANPREVEEYKKRYQNQLDVWNKYNNPDYAEITDDDWAAAMGEPTPTTPPSVPTAAKPKVTATQATPQPAATPSYGSGWTAKQGPITVNTGTKPKAESAGGVPWNMRK